MKNRTLAMVLSAMMILSLAACGQPAADTSSASAASEAAAAVSEAEEDASEAEEAAAEEAVSEAEEAAAEEAASETEQEAEEMAETLPGGWQKPESPVITDEIRAVVEKALDELVGASYIPVAYIGTQLVSGRNYAILCRTAPVVPDAVETYAIVYIYEDLDGNAKLTDVRDFGVETNINELAGGWRQAEDPTVTEDLAAIFAAATEELLGVDYTPAALLGTQVVNGTNYCFLCEAAVVAPDAAAEYKLVYVNQDSAGNVTLDEVVDLVPAEEA